MAFRMQFAVPDAFDLSGETQETLDLYGDSEYAKGCLLARRLIERGVRVVQLSHSIDGYDIAWDTGHNEIKGGHAKLAKACDQGIAALIQDLKRRGLFDETLVIWGGEFGRAPTSEGKNGRDHDHYGFTTWLAGGGVKGGHTYGATDQFGLTAVENRASGSISPSRTAKRLNGRTGSTSSSFPWWWGRGTCRGSLSGRPTVAGRRRQTRFPTPIEFRPNRLPRKCGPATMCQLPSI
jgi:hypothetical protein